MAHIQLKTVTKLLLAGVALTVLASGCSPKAPKGETTIAAETKVDVAAEDARLIEFLDAAFEESVAQSPETQAYLGRKTNMDKWDERTDEADAAELAMTERQLADMRAQFNRDNLSDEGKLNYDLFEYSSEEDIELAKFRNQRFVLSQFRGVHSNIPVLLANYHKITSTEDAENYIARVSKIAVILDQAATQMETRAAAGYTLPEFSYPQIVESGKNVISGKPFEGETDSPILADFRAKVTALEVDDATKADLIARLEAALLASALPGYMDFNNRTAAIGETVEGNYGIGDVSGKVNGDNYYNALLASYTTTDMTAEEVHDLGLREVDRIHDEMEQIKEQVGFDGTLQEFFDYMRVTPQFYLPNTDEGRQTYLDQAQAYVDGMRVKLPELFITLPKAPLEVRRVEAFREGSAGKAFYNQPSPDGSRPGIFYANLLKMEDMPTYQLEALVYHEAVPGHHMQRTIQIERGDLPKFRQFGGYTAYTEGWGLYSELLGKDLGFYQDPYSDFGRLAMELWRAARLVVDTGLHYKGWELQEAVEYLKDNTPNPEGDCQKAIERYIVYPGQATAYKIGMIKLVELRAKTKAALGDKFSIAEFHDVVLTGGPVPLAVLESRIDDYIASKQA